jgi:hypothetical protein
MKARDFLDEILPILYTVKEDKEKLQKILQFLKDEIYEGPEEIEIPEKYKPLVKEIAGNLDAGLICYLNPDTLELEDIPENLVNDPYEFEAMTGTSLEDWGLKNSEWENCLTFEPLESHESFQIMETFTNNLVDTRFQEKLANALNRRKPFANFKVIIDNSAYRQNWFDFKNQWMENHVKELLLFELQRKLEDQDEDDVS